MKNDECEGSHICAVWNGLGLGETVPKLELST